jgi:hypothetical protein
MPSIPTYPMMVECHTFLTLGLEWPIRVLSVWRDEGDEPPKRNMPATGCRNHATAVYLGCGSNVSYSLIQLIRSRHSNPSVCAPPDTKRANEAWVRRYCRIENSRNWHTLVISPVSFVISHTGTAGCRMGRHNMCRSNNKNLRSALN